MKKRYLFLIFVMILTFTLLVSCKENAETTAEGTTSSTEQEGDVTTTDTITAETTEAVTTEKEIVVTPVDLSFTETNVCASKYDPKSNYTEGNFSVWDRWYSTDYVDISEFYGLYYELGSHKYLISVSFFDANQVYISGVGTTTTSSCATVSGYVEVPQHAKYARFITFTGITSNNSYITPCVNGYATKADYEAALAQKPYHDLTVACIGDSLTEGDIGSLHGGADIDYRNYPHYLGKLLGNTTINYGKCGYTAQMILNSFNNGDIDVTEADVILIMLGTNAGLKSTGNTQYMAYRNLITKIRAVMKEGARIVLITPPHASANKASVSQTVYQYVEEAARTVVEIGEELGLDVIDAHNESPIQEEKENIYQPNDGLHMSQTGYEVFANYIAEELIKLMEAKAE